MTTNLRTPLPSTLLKPLVAGVVGAVLLLAVVLAPAQVTADQDSGSYEQTLMERLTPDQLEAFLAGGDPATIVLEDGTTLEDFLLEGLIDTASNSVYHPLNQCLVVRTATDLGGGKYGANENRPHTVRGTCGVPLEATAVVMNAKIYAAASSGQVSIYPTGHTATPAVVNVKPSEAANNMVTVAMGSVGDFSVRPSVAVHAVIHTVGYFAPLVGAVGPTGPTGSPGMDGADGPTGPTGPGGLPLTCADSEIARWDGNTSEWVCAVDPMTADVKAAICELYGVSTLPEFCPLTVFVTSGTYTGDLVAEAGNLCAVSPFGGAGPCPDGLTAADAICSKLAFDAGLPRTTVGAIGFGEPLVHGYKAWLSTSTVDAKDRLTVANNPWHRVDGARVADNLADLLDCTNPDCLQNPIFLDELGGSSTNRAWTGTNNIGLYQSAAPWTQCNNWTHGLVGAGSGGLLGSTSPTWTTTYPGVSGCGLSNPIYCFGQ